MAHLLIVSSSLSSGEFSGYGYYTLGVGEMPDPFEHGLKDLAWDDPKIIALMHQGDAAAEVIQSGFDARAAGKTRLHFRSHHGLHRAPLIADSFAALMEAQGHTVELRHVKLEMVERAKDEAAFEAKQQLIRLERARVLWEALSKQVIHHGGAEPIKVTFDTGSYNRSAPESVWHMTERKVTPFDFPLELQNQSGFDTQMIDYLKTNPDVVERIRTIIELVTSGARKHYICCRDGRRASVFVAEQAARLLQDAGYSVKVTHHHIDAPVHTLKASELFGSPMTPLKTIKADLVPHDDIVQIFAGTPDQLAGKVAGHATISVGMKLQSNPYQKDLAFNHPDVVEWHKTSDKLSLAKLEADLVQKLNDGNRIIGFFSGTPARKASFAASHFASLLKGDGVDVMVHDLTSNVPYLAALDLESASVASLQDILDQAVPLAPGALETTTLPAAIFQPMYVDTYKPDIQAPTTPPVPDSALHALLKPKHQPKPIFVSRKFSLKLTVKPHLPLYIGSASAHADVIVNHKVHHPKNVIDVSSAFLSLKAANQSGFGSYLIDEMLGWPGLGHHLIKALTTFENAQRMVFFTDPDGQNRSVFMAEYLTALLNEAGHTSLVRHYDLANHTQKAHHISSLEYREGLYRLIPNAYGTLPFVLSAKHP